MSVKALGAVFNVFESAAHEHISEKPADLMSDSADAQEEEMGGGELWGKEKAEANAGEGDGETLASGNIDNWLSSLGDTIVHGAPLAPEEADQAGEQVGDNAVEQQAGEQLGEKDAEQQAGELTDLTDRSVVVVRRRASSELCNFSITRGAGAYATNKVLVGVMRRSLEVAMKQWKAAVKKHELRISISDSAFTLTFSVGDRVKVTKEGSQKGKLATVTNGEWNGLVKVAMDHSESGMASDQTSVEKSYKSSELTWADEGGQQQQQQQQHRAQERERGRDSVSESEEDNVPEFSHAFEKYSIIIVLLYILLSAAIIHFLERGSSMPLDYFHSLYFIVITLTTVGYGNYVPKTAGGKIFVCIFEIIGLSIVAAALGALMSQIIEATRQARQHKAKKSIDDAVEPWAKDQEMGQGLGDPLLAGTDSSTNNGEQGTSMMRSTMQARSLSYWLSSLAKPLLRMAAMSAVGTIFMCSHGGYSVVDGFYWSIITLTSVGYGDITPSDDAGLAFTLVYAIVGVAVFGECLGRFLQLWVEMEDERKVQAFIEKGVTRQTIKEIDGDGDAQVDRAEFLQYMLVNMNKAQHEDIEMINALFDSLDADGSGVLDMDDIPEGGVDVSNMGSPYTSPHSDFGPGAVVTRTNF
jgi:potassium channel subfamily K